MIRIHFLFFCLLLLLQSPVTFAQTYSVTWDFGTSVSPTRYASSSTNANVPAGNCDADTGNVCCAFVPGSYTPVFLWSGASANFYTGKSGEPTIRNNAKNGAFNVNTSTYFSFYVRPNTGYSVKVTGIEFAGYRINAVGPAQYTVRSSTDGFTANVGNSTFGTNFGGAKYSHTGLSLTGAANAPVEMRIYTHNGLATATSGNVILDDVIIYYELIPVIVTGITTGNIAGNPLCTGGAVSIPYTVTGSFNSGNIFTAQLSDASGSFASPVNIGTANSTTSGNINATIPAATATGTAYRIRVISSTPSVTGTDNGTNLTIDQSVTPSVTVAANPGSSICNGTSVSFTASPTNGGSSPSYAWKKGIQTVGNGQVYTDNGLANGDVITVEMTSNATCATPNPVSSTPVNMTVNTLLTPAVTIAENPGNNICQGTPVTFTASPTNGGATPLYQWKKNNNSVGTNSDTYTDNALANGDIITLVMMSSEACVTNNNATSNAITMTVDPLVIPTVSINVNPGNSICEGTPVTFTSTISNGGVSPTYQWKINSNNAGTGSTYTTSNLSDGNMVSLEVISSTTCAVTTPVVSNVIKMDVSPTTPPVALLTVQPQDTIIPGQLVTFTLYIAYGGSNPTIVWYKNGQVITGASGNVYSYNATGYNDTVICFVQSSNSCANPDTTTSNAYVIRNIAMDIKDYKVAGDVNIYPNPNNGSFIIEGGGLHINTPLEVASMNMQGQMIYHSSIQMKNDKFREQIDLSNMPKGSYLLHLHAPGYRKTMHFIIR